MNFFYLKLVLYYSISCSQPYHYHWRSFWDFSSTRFEGVLFKNWPSCMYGFHKNNCYLCSGGKGGRGVVLTLFSMQGFRGCLGPSEVWWQNTRGRSGEVKSTLVPQYSSLTVVCPIRAWNLCFACVCVWGEIVNDAPFFIGWGALFSLYNKKKE